MDVTPEKLAEVRAFFEKDRFATENGAVIESVDEHAAICSLMLTDRHKNAMGGVMGGVPFMLADFTFAVASNWQGKPTVSIHSDISFLATVRGSSLTASAELVKDGKTTCVYTVRITDDTGRHVALATVTGCHVN